MAYIGVLCSGLAMILSLINIFNNILHDAVTFQKQLYNSYYELKYSENILLNNMNKMVCMTESSFKEFLIVLYNNSLSNAIEYLHTTVHIQNNSIDELIRLKDQNVQYLNNLQQLIEFQQSFNGHISGMYKLDINHTPYFEYVSNYNKCKG